MHKALIGYTIEEGISEVEYERWLFDIHAPDLLANPHLDRIVFNKVHGVVDSASGSDMVIPDGVSLYRVAELHFADRAAYAAYREWFDAHPIPAERSPAGRTHFRFYVHASSQVVARSPRV